MSLKRLFVKFFSIRVYPLCLQCAREQGSILHIPKKCQTIPLISRWQQPDKVCQDGKEEGRSLRDINPNNAGWKKEKKVRTTFVGSQEKILF